MKNHYFLIIVLGLVTALALSAHFSQPLTAQENEIPKLQQKIAALESRLDHLEALLKEQNNPKTETSGLEFGWQNKKNWRNLKLGMTEAKVLTILGEPIKAIKGIRTLWYYPNIYCGYVSFDREGRLIGWNEP